MERDKQTQPVITPASKKESLSGSEILIRSLLAEGVDTVFGYPGGAIMPVFDALYDYKESIKHILVRHEQGAVHAAQGYARVSRKWGWPLLPPVQEPLTPSPVSPMP